MNYAGHFYLSGRAVGSTRRLLGRVLLVTAFVDVGSSCWTDGEMRRCGEIIRRCAARLAREAGHYGRDLSFIRTTCRGQLPAGQDFYKQSGYWADKVAKQAGFQNAGMLIIRSGEQHQADEAAFLLILHEDKRSFATMARANMAGFVPEYAVIFKNNLREHVIEHELLHLFGCQDYYYPAETKRIAEDLFPDSIMLGKTMIDPLTAYVVGWTEDLAGDARRFLDRTKHISREQVEKALLRSWNGETPEAERGKRPDPGKKPDKTTRKETQSQVRDGRQDRAQEKVRKKPQDRADESHFVIPGVWLRADSVMWDCWEDGTHRRFLSESLRYESAAEDHSQGAFFKRMKAIMEKSTGRTVPGCVLAAPTDSIQKQLTLMKFAENAGLSVRLVSPAKAAAAALAVRDKLGSRETADISVFLQDGKDLEICLAECKSDTVEILGAFRRRLVSGESVTRESLRMMMEIILDECGVLTADGLHCIYYSTSFTDPIRAYAQEIGCPSLPFEQELTVQGAAIQAARLTGRLPGMLLDALSCDFTLAETEETILLRGTAIPVRDSIRRPFADIVNDRGMLVISSQGSPCSATRMKEYLEIPVFDIWDGRDTSQLAEIEISVEADSRVHIRVKNLSSGKETKN